MEEINAKSSIQNQIGKLDKFDETFFKRWKGKLLFFLTNMKLANVLTENKHEEKAEETFDETAKRLKWSEDDFMCKGHILNALLNILYDVYAAKFADGTTRQLWKDLDNKYKSEDAGHKKFRVSQLFEYKIVNNKSVMAQVHELQFIMNQLISEGRNIDETFQVSTIISKLPMTWKDCRNELKQTKDAITMQELIEYLQIEENSAIWVIWN
ncbi:uncharacterized protein LOC143890019 [Tasmannia lanceolata]|uniref:uncharacterized protein LOC143890019 n=1 Tax=Tasmannia lanceolata TaxID=3420 RepID=UPI004062C1A0